MTLKENRQKQITMKTTRLFTLLALLTVFALGCNKTDETNNGGNNNDTDVRVTTYTPQDITATTAKCGGDVIVTQGLSITEIGVCWSTERNPEASDVHIATMEWETPFVCTLTGLEPETKYYVRAYALRGLEYYYGNEVSFTTEVNGSGGNNGGGVVNGHSFIDLGLPSGTLWATCNVGADTPEDYGDYFSWGELSNKESYNWNTYSYSNGNGNQLTKYCSDSHYGYNGFTDTLSILQEADDVAKEIWGNGWQMPSQQEWYELMSYCSHCWTNQNNVNGILFTSPNGGSLFFPSAGYYFENEVVNAEAVGYYWSNSINIGAPMYSRGINFSSNDYVVGSMWRCYGIPVRPVRKTE